MPIDFLKIRTKQEGLKEHLLSTFDFTGEYHVSTGEVASEPKLTCEKSEFKIIIHPSGSIEFRGSLHKYYNQCSFNGNQFTYLHLLEALQRFKTEFNVTLEAAIIQNLEFGVNLKVPVPPKQLIASLLAYKNKAFDLNTFNGYGYLKQWGSHNYFLIKCYDKSTQYRMHEKVMRFEAKYRRMSKLKHTGIISLADLTDVSKLSILRTDLEQMFKDMILVEDIDTETISNDEFKLYYELKNAQNWEKYNPSTRKHRKKQKDRLMFKFGKGVHKELINLMNTQLNSLLSYVPCFTPLSIA